ncbi:cation diffusion facilitator family transporter [Plebeiibacterium sediminum]|uniref:Cation diffusion facilitator family transporter n=1 Tax=Plebeiibacterium sediminum TaxID=2992112 RepID=A0AAE3M132_9BACT|nr:cation diffusion facilitator family transporter [Plebeiobacterium sediminum]MCW3785164.1 cation diffusion facilitator family transporter [Plebeiobacterium sediminum]
MEKYKLGIFISWASIILNIALFIIKFWAGILFHSVALIADAWHTLTDSISSVAVLIGIKISSKPADETHPFGHGRAELMSTIFVGILLALVGANFTYESVLKLRMHESVEYGNFAIIVTIISIVVKEVMAQYSIFYGKKINAKSLIADGWHHRSDAFSSIIILGGIFVGKYFWWVDGVLGLLVSLLIFYTTYKILKESLSIFLGEKIDDDLKESIQKIGIHNFNSDLDPHHFLIHQYGNHSELTFHISLPGNMSLTEAHQIATKYENAIMEIHSIGVTIHIDSLDEYNNVRIK